MRYGKRLLFMFGGCFFWFFTAVLFSQNLTVSKIGEWGTGQYLDIYVQDNYAYCAANDNGLAIIDVTDRTNPRQVGHYDTSGNSRNVVAAGNYAYLLEEEKGLLILDISNPLLPYRVGYYSNLNYNSTLNSNITVKGNFAYITDTRGLHILDVSIPSSPRRTAFYPLEGMGKIVVNGFYAYAMYQTGFYVFDVSDPLKPALISTYDVGWPGYVSDIFIEGYITVPSRYIYVLGMDTPGTGMIFKIIDINDPASPQLVGSSEPRGGYKVKISVKNNYAYVAANWATVDHDVKSSLEVYDVSNPSAPTYLGMSTSYYGAITGFFMKVDGLAMKFNEIYTCNRYCGLQIFDNSTLPALPLVGTSPTYSQLEDVFVRGSYAYGVDYYSGLVVLDITSPSQPVLLGHLDTPGRGHDVLVSGNYAYVADGEEGLQIIDVSDPRAPRLVGNYDNAYARGVFIRGNRAYLAAGGLLIIDISNPSAPSLLGGYSEANSEFITNSVFVSGNYAYTANSDGEGGGFKVIDVSNPAAPVLVGKINSDYLQFSTDVYVTGTTAYVAARWLMFIMDVSDPASPQVKSYFTVPGTDYGNYIGSIDVSGTDVYLGIYDGSVHVIDAKNPTTPTLLGSYTPLGDVGAISGIFVNGGYIYASDSETGYIPVFQTGTSSTSAQLSLSRSNLNFGAQNGISTNTQSVVVENHGTGIMDWSTTTSQGWLKFAPSSGSGSGEILVSVDTTDLSPGTYSGTLSVSSPQAVNSPQTVTVNLQVYETGMTTSPFGAFSTPLEGAAVSGSIPVTGWVLDDIGVHYVAINVESGGNLFYIGNAVMVEGARPDIETAYPGYPNNYRAGWGYMMLTNFLPNQGNGTYTLYAIAVDQEGIAVSLGTKTIHVDNAHAVKPFGAIDSPPQGGTISSSNYINYGWALTPLPNTIPTNGSTITVWVDGVPLGNPLYNRNRADVETLFPNYNNSAGAGGEFQLDTTEYENGVHTISWSVTDNAGNSDGIGSRYFIIQNLSSSTAQASSNYQKFLEVQEPFFQKGSWPPEALSFQKGYNPESEPESLFPDENGRITVEIKELERLVIYLDDLEIQSDAGEYEKQTEPRQEFQDEDSGEPRVHPIFSNSHSTLNTKHLTLKNTPPTIFQGYLINGDRLKPLPIGSTLDAERGIFYWQPGPGFLGDYELVFIKETNTGEGRKKHIIIRIKPYSG